MPAKSSFDYAMIRVVPRPEREEFLNAGVVLFCVARDYLKARTVPDQRRLANLWPEVDVSMVADHLAAFSSICDGAPDAGPIAKLTRRERFHWLVAPRSTVIQVSPVHSGLCGDPELALEELFQRYVLVGQPARLGSVPK